MKCQWPGCYNETLGPMYCRLHSPAQPEDQSEPFSPDPMPDIFSDSGTDITPDSSPDTTSDFGGFGDGESGGGGEGGSY